LGGGLNRILGGAFRAFNRGLHSITHGYTRLVGGLLRVSLVVLVVYCGLLGLTWWRYQDHVTPKGFIPPQDMGYLLINIQLPDAAATERTQAVVDEMMEIARKEPGIRHVSGVVGQSLVANAFGSTFGTMFVNLQPYEKRRDPSMSSMAIMGKLYAKFGQAIKGANVIVFPPPPVRGVGRAGGFMMMVEDRGDLGPVKLQDETAALVAKANEQQGKLMVFPSSFRANVPQLKVEPDIRECMEKG